MADLAFELLLRLSPAWLSSLALVLFVCLSKSSRACQVPPLSALFVGFYLSVSANICLFSPPSLFTEQFFASTGPCIR